jgi:hypothetical protein
VRRLPAMNWLALLLISFLAPTTGAEPTPAPAPAPASTATAGSPTYLVIYRPGPAWLPGKPLKQQPLREHGKLFESGTLRFAGGFGDDSGGALAFSAPTPEAALEIVQKDPAVISGLFLYELHPWGLVDWPDRLAKSRAAEPKR